jgi:hypothetical protein
MGEESRALHRLRHEELVAEADAARRARRCRGPARPGPLLRLYARLWWASRPRAGRWTGELLPV